MNNEIILYKSEEGIAFDVKLEQDTVWLTLNQIADLFQKAKSTISWHLNKIYKEKELSRKATVRKYRTVQIEAGRNVDRDLEYYNLDAIISVGYRVNSKRGTQFRIWATNILRDHLLNGYSVNSHKLKSVENKIDLLLKTKDIHADQIKQLQEDQFFIKKIFKPNFINKIYIDTKPIIESNKQNMEEFKEKLEELNKILKEIETKLPAKSELKILIKDAQNNAEKAHEDPDAKNKLIKTIEDLGDSTSSISKMLTAAGVTKNILVKAYEIGLFLVRHLPF